MSDTTVAISQAEVTAGISHSFQAPSKHSSWVEFEDDENRSSVLMRAEPAANRKPTLETNNNVNNNNNNNNNSTTSSNEQHLHSLSSSVSLSTQSQSTFKPDNVATLTPSKSEFTGTPASLSPVPLPTSSSMSPLKSKSSPVAAVIDNLRTEVVSPVRTESHIEILQNVPLKDHSGTSTLSGHHFNNGDLLVSLLPLNSHCSWLTPAMFKPELVPEELMAQGLRLTVEDYVAALQVLVNDFRFNMYIMFYKRLLVILTLIGFIILMSLLFSGTKGFALFIGTFVWLLINAFGIFLTLWLKCKMTRNLEKCMAQVNEMFSKYNLLACVDDKGKISCHKINLIFIYFDVTYCVKYLNDMIINEERARDPTVAINSTIQSLNSMNNNSNHNGLNNFNNGFISTNSTTTTMTNSSSFWNNDVNISDIIITGATPTRLSQKQKYGEKLLLRYSQRYVKDFTRRKLGLNIPLHSDATITPPVNLQPRHCAVARCPCQYIEEHLKFKPQNQFSLKDLFV